MVKRFLLSGLALAAVILLLCPIALGAETARQVDISITGDGYNSHGFLNNGDNMDYVTSYGSCSVTVESSTPFSALYLMFDLEYGKYTIRDNCSDLTYTAGEYEFLHEYVQLAQATTSVTLDFSSGRVSLSEITAFTEGAAPEGVQVWQPPLDGKADILLMSTHGDDEQLYFAGLLPLYAAERDCAVQVAYMTDHRSMTMLRTHEMLNGLWAVGVRNYPVFGRFWDFRLDDLEASYNYYAAMGTTKEDLMTYVVEQLRRFKPQVVVGHDFEGEYGHGMHRIYTDLLVQALDIIGDETAFPESAQRYGTWEVAKTYIHLYQENPIVIDYDIPLESFDGMTAFQVSQHIGFPCHETQLMVDDFTDWIYGKDGKITMAREITQWSPCQFGLYRSTVGPDVACNDFMENITSYAEAVRQEAERIENERLEKERQEQARLEAARLEQERLEQERLAQEAALKAAEEKAAREQELKKIIGISAGAAVLVALAVAVFLLIRKWRAK